MLILILTLLCVWIYISSGTAQRQTDQVQQVQPVENIAVDDSDDQFVVEGFVLLESESGIYTHVPTQKDTITYEGTVEVTYSEYHGTYKLYLAENPWVSHFKNDESIPFEISTYEPGVGTLGLMSITEAEIDDLCGYDCTTVEYGPSVYASIDAFNEIGLSIPVVFRVEFIQFVPRTDINALAIKTVAVSDLSRQ